MAVNPLAIITVLILSESVILALAAHPRFVRFFKFLPAVFWIYAVPMLMSSAGIIDSQSPVYSRLSKWILPPSLFLLLVGVRLKDVFSMGRPALIMMLAGTAGMVAGTPLIFGLFRRWVGNEFWSGFAALAGSWTGGSANMIAVKEALGTPDAVFLPMVVVDTLVPYLWMGMLIAALPLREAFNRFTRTDRTTLIALQDISLKAGQAPTVRWHPWRTGGIVATAFITGGIIQAVSGQLPTIEDVISPYAWTIILISTLALVCSLTPLRRAEAHGASKIGYYLLYFVLTTIGARADITHLQAAPILILAGTCMVVFQAVVLVGTAWLIRAPMFLATTASQANMGGVASGPIVAEIYQPGLASVGLLMAILGNVTGTYAGILSGQLCRLFL